MQETPTSPGARCTRSCKKYSWHLPRPGDSRSGGTRLDGVYASCGACTRKGWGRFPSFCHEFRLMWSKPGYGFCDCEPCDRLSSGASDETDGSRETCGLHGDAMMGLQGGVLFASRTPPCAALRLVASWYVRRERESSAAKVLPWELNVVSRHRGDWRVTRTRAF